MAKSKDKLQYGDFQTPHELARKACQLLGSQICEPASIIEPTCGRGSFLVAAAQQFKNANRIVGLDINPEYVDCARQSANANSQGRRLDIYCSDFFLLIGIR